MTVTEQELAAMHRAIAVAAQGVGRSSPNPPVGCVVLAADGTPVGEGYHLRKGEPHAEAQALAAAGRRAGGGTAVVTLEPCNHHGRTPPCRQALLDAHIARVVVSLLDPTSRGDGGVNVLRMHGVSVEVGVLATEALTVLGAWRASLDHGPRLTWLYAIDPAGRPGPPPTGSAADTDAAIIQRRSDLLVTDNLAVSEPVPGSHEWKPPRPDGTTGPALLDRLAAAGARTVTLTASDTTAAPFLADQRLDRIVAYLAATSPSAVPPARLDPLPADFRIVEAVALDEWVRITGTRL